MDDNVALDSSVALAVLEKLFEVEKTLENEQFQFNQEAKNILEDIAEAVKKLEQMRKSTIDHLEIESIEISRLRFVLWRLPESISKEIEDAVLAARKSNSDEISKLHIAIKKVSCEIELLNKKLSSLEKRNIELSNEQDEISESHQKAVMLLNLKLKEKAENNVSTGEINERRRLEEERIEYLKRLLKELKETLELEKLECEKKKTKLEKMISDLKKQKENEIKKSLEKKQTLATLTAQIVALKEEFKEQSGALTEQIVEKVQLRDGMKTLKAQLKTDLKQPETLHKKKKDYETALKEFLEISREEHAELLKKLKLANEKLSVIQARNSDLNGKNKILRDQLKVVRQEESDYYLARMTAQEINDKILDSVSEKKAFLVKKRNDIKALEEAVDNLQHLFVSTTESYRKQIDFMKDNWIKESQRSILNQWKILHLRKKHERWVKEEEATIKKLIERIDQVEKQRIQILEESINCDEEISKHEEIIEDLSMQLKEEEKVFAQLELDISEQLKLLEEKYAMNMEQTKAREEELDMYMPKVRGIEVEYEEQMKEFEELRCHISAQNREEQSLTYGISLMKREIAKFEDETENLKKLLKQKRSDEFSKLKAYLSVIQTSEREIFEIEQKLFVLLLENHRIRKALMELKQKIEYFKTEGENHNASQEKMDLELEELDDTYEKRWNETLVEIKKFKEMNKPTLMEIIELIKKLYLRDEKLKVICHWFKRNIENMNYIIDYKDSDTNIKATAKTDKKRRMAITKIERKGTKRS